MLHKYLEHFKAVAETSSMLRASEILFISQPSLSRSIKILEEIIDTKLFERKNKGVELTEYGEVLYAQVCSMGNEFRYALEEIEYLKNRGVKKLRIGSGLAWQYGIFPKIVRQYTNSYPDIQLTVITGYSKKVYEGLLEGKFDIIFCDISNLKPMAGIIQEHLLNVCFSFYAHWNHPIFKKKNIREHDLDQFDFAVFSHSNQVADQDIEDDNMLSQSSRRRIKYISGSMINLMEAVSSTRYLTVLPQPISFIAEQFGLKEIHPDLRRASFPSGMVYHKSCLEKDHIRSFIESVRDVV